MPRKILNTRERQQAEALTLRILGYRGCYWCGREDDCNLGHNAYENVCNRVHLRLEYEHLTPVSHDGTNDAGNVVLACRSCNRSRGNRLRPKLVAV